MELQRFSEERIISSGRSNSYYVMCGRRDAGRQRHWGWQLYYYLC